MGAPSRVEFITADELRSWLAPRPDQSFALELLRDMYSDEEIEALLVRLWNRSRITKRISYPRTGAA